MKTALTLTLNLVAGEANGYWHTLADKYDCVLQFGDKLQIQSKRNVVDKKCRLMLMALVLYRNLAWDNPPHIQLAAQQWSDEAPFPGVSSPSTAPISKWKRGEVPTVTGFTDWEDLGFPRVATSHNRMSHVGKLVRLVDDVGAVLAIPDQSKEYFEWFIQPKKGCAKGEEITTIQLATIMMIPTLCRDFWPDEIFDEAVELTFMKRFKLEFPSGERAPAKCPLLVTRDLSGACLYIFVTSESSPMILV